MRSNYIFLLTLSISMLAGCGTDETDSTQVSGDPPPVNNPPDNNPPDNNPPDNNPPDNNPPDNNPPDNNPPDNNPPDNNPPDNNPPDNNTPPTDTSTVPPAILINEVRSTGDFDFIELYNADSESYTFAEGEWVVNDLKGLVEDNEPGVAIPGGTVLPAGGFLLIAPDENNIPSGAPSDTIIPGSGDSDFGLGRGDTALLIFNGQVVDRVGWQDGTHVDTFGRIPDGGPLHDEAEPLQATPGAANRLSAAGPQNIVINEIVSKGRDDIDFDYVELHNTSSEPYIFAENEWELVDANRDGEGTPGLVIPGGTEIPGKGFVVLIPNITTTEGLPANAPSNAILTTNEGFGLGKGDTVILKHNGQAQETVTWGNFHVNSLGRLPDGADFITLNAENDPQLYASPGRKNFRAPLELESEQIDFTAFNSRESDLEKAGLRVFGPNADLATDVEPEYIVVSSDSTTAWVALQENNGIARVNLTQNQVTDIFPLGFKDHSVAGNEIDTSDDDQFNPRLVDNLFGMYQPDAIASIEIAGQTYILSANEGDSRDWMDEDVRLKNVQLDSNFFPNAADLQQDAQAGRLKITPFLFNSTAIATHTEIHSFGARSFSIWNGTTGALVYDSANLLEVEANNAGVIPHNRSDDKGVEPEGITVGFVGTSTLAFVGLERANAIAVFDISNINNPIFNELLTHANDDAPEGLLFISARDSASNNPLLVVSNEKSATVTVYEYNNNTFTVASSIVLEGDEGAAEITAYHAASRQLFVVNNGEDLSQPRVEVLDLSDPQNVSVLTTIDTSFYGAGINSVAVNGNRLAVAIESETKTNLGVVAVFDTADHSLQAISVVGALPDMVTFTPDGTKILTADEGEPNDDYSVDPIGSISVITLP